MVSTRLSHLAFGLIVAVASLAYVAPMLVVSLFAASGSGADLALN